MVKTSWAVRGEYFSLSRHLTEHSAKQDKASESATFSNLFQQHLPQFRRLADQNCIQMEKCQMEKLYTAENRAWQLQNLLCLQNSKLEIAGCVHRKHTW
jgi:hypothetical protein